MKRLIIFAVLLFCGVLIPPRAEAAGLSQSAPGYEFAMVADYFLLAGHDGERGGNGKQGGNRQEKHERMQERIEQMPPEQREEAQRRLDEMEAKHRRIKEELEALPPEERKARMEELREEFNEAGEDRKEEFREKFRQKWDSASPDERADFCGNARARCAEGGSHACEFVQKSCGE